MSQRERARRDAIEATCYGAWAQTRGFLLLLPSTPHAAESKSPKVLGKGGWASDAVGITGWLALVAEVEVFSSCLVHGGGVCHTLSLSPLASDTRAGKRSELVFLSASPPVAGTDRVGRGVCVLVRSSIWSRLASSGGGGGGG